MTDDYYSNCRKSVARVALLVVVTDWLSCEWPVSMAGLFGVLWQHVDYCLCNCHLVLYVGRYRRRCCKKAGVVLTVRSVKVVASLTMKAVWFSVTNVTSASTFIALIHHWKRFRRAHGSASGALYAWLVVQRRQASSMAVRGRTTTRSVQGVPVLRCVQHVQSATLTASSYCSVLIVNGLFSHNFVCLKNFVKVW